MNKKIEYSVIIRTTGNAHEKYQALLDSITKLDPQPIEIIVVIPEGYEPPTEQIGTERFVYSPKGMLIQRINGISVCSTPYALLCDDDVIFNADFVKLLYRPIERGLGGISAGPLYSFLPNGPKRTLIDWIRAAAAPTILHHNRYVSVLRSTGYSYNKKLKKGVLYESQSVAGTCFFVDVELFKKSKIEEEVWVDANGYAAMEDQVMIYKSWLLGNKTIVVPEAIYEHLDAKTSTISRNNNIAYSRCFNRYIFWHRFIYNQQHDCVNRLFSRIAWSYRICFEHLIEVINLSRGRITWDEFVLVQHSWNDAKKYIHTAEYKDLPKV